MELKYVYEWLDLQLEKWPLDLGIILFQNSKTSQIDIMDNLFPICSVLLHTMHASKESLMVSPANPMSHQDLERGCFEYIMHIVFYFIN